MEEENIIPIWKERKLTLKKQSQKILHMGRRILDIGCVSTVSREREK